MSGILKLKARGVLCPAHSRGGDEPLPMWLLRQLLELLGLNVDDLLKSHYVQ